MAEKEPDLEDFSKKNSGQENQSRRNPERGGARQDAESDSQSGLEAVREKIRDSEDEESEGADVLNVPRIARKYESAPAKMNPDDIAAVETVAAETRQRLAENYFPGFGVFPSAGKDSNFYNQVYARDSSHALGNYYAEINPQALQDSLSTLLKYQKPNGMLPLRVEREYQLLKLVPGFRRLTKPIFKFWEKTFHNRAEKPVYQGEDFGLSTAQDTIPAAIIAAGEFFLASDAGKKFVGEHFGQLKKAADYFMGGVDKFDNLADIKGNAPDWADTLKRSGKLGVINVLWARSLHLLEYMARQLGKQEDAKKFLDQFQKTKKSVLAKIYNSKESYFRAKAGEQRLDTVASVFGALYLLNPEECVKVEETLKRRVLKSSGLQNFDPPYAEEDMILLPKITRHAQTYHNTLVWPWVTLENVQVKIKIALQHRDEKIRAQYKQEAADDVLRMAKLFTAAGGAYEIFEADRPVPGQTMLYRPPKNFMGSMASFMGAYLQLKKLGWI